MSDNQTRQLTGKEKERAEIFAATEARLKEDGYTRKDLTISITKANFVGLLLVLPVMAILCAVFFLINGFGPVTSLFKSVNVTTGIWLIVSGLSMVPLAVVHEGIHGISWGLFAKEHMKDIEYGFIKEMLTPYCYCRSPLNKGQYIFGSMMPMTLLGIVVCVSGIIFANVFLMIIGLLQVLGGSGDILITSMLLRYKTKGKDIVLQDHPTECGLIIFEK